jgi:hypothetical protein
MSRIVSVITLALLGSCMRSPVVAPAPVSFHSPRSAKEATQIAAVALMNAGFRVMQTDSIGNALAGTRTATHNGNQEYVICELPNGAGAAANRETALAVSFKATPGSEGSDVSISSRVTTSYPGYAGTAMQTPANETDCVSNGTIEHQLESALR